MNILHSQEVHTTIINAKDDNLEKLLGSNAQPAIIYFWSTWCGPCAQVIPIINNLAQELKSKVKIVKVNIEENKNTVKQYKILSLPTILLLDANQKEISRQIGISCNLQEVILEILDPCIT